ncbi:hypothetical protein PAPHI01_1593 [Pancytospora philotis]|nr:hypothetical protein PAPHI01_1593 [Pancytospora philotis]
MKCASLMRTALVALQLCVCAPPTKRKRTIQAPRQAANSEAIQTDIWKRAPVLIKRPLPETAYTKMCVRLYEWWMAKNKDEPLKSQVTFPVRAESSELSNINRCVRIRTFLLASGNMFERISAMAKEMPYSALEIMRNIIDGIRDDKTQAYIDGKYRSDVAAVLINTKDNRTPEQLSALKEHISKEIRALLLKPTSECIKADRTKWRRADILFHLLRRMELYDADFYKELSDVFRVLLGDGTLDTETEESVLALLELVIQTLRAKDFDTVKNVNTNPGTTNAATANPDITNANTTIPSADERIIRAKEALLKNAIYSSDSAILSLFISKTWASEPRLDIVGWLASNIDKSISPHFIISIASSYNNREVRGMPADPALTKLLHSYYFGDVAPSLKAERINATFRNQEIITLLPAQFLSDMISKLQSLDENTPTDTSLSRRNLLHVLSAEKRARVENIQETATKQ